MKLTIHIDVFLTTMKPQQKVVTASDVQSSLYYVHMDSVEDYKLLESQDSEEEDEPADDTAIYPPLSKQTSVRRKPLLSSRSLGMDDRPEHPPEIYPRFRTPMNNMNGHTQVGRKPVPSVNMQPKKSLEQSPPLPERKVLGPSPMNQRFSNADIPALQAVPERQNIDLRRWSEQPAAIPPRLPSRPNSEVSNEFRNTRLVEEGPLLQVQMALMNRGSTAEHCWEWEKDWQNKRMSEDMGGSPSLPFINEGMPAGFDDASLSLIRRYNAQQWNVGKIVNQGKGSVSRNTANSGAGFSIEIMTPGYAKFVNARIPGNEELEISPEASHEGSSLSGSRSDASSIDRADKAKFRRHLWLSGHAMRPDRSRRLESTESVFNQETRLSFDSQRRSEQGLDSISPSAIAPSESKTAPSRPFTFDSPWDGRCEFTTGIAGRSLKCKHSYASTNPNFGPGMRSATVSELRFNLPSSQAFGTTTPKSLTPGTPREAKRSSMFRSNRKQRLSSSFDTAEPMRNDYFGSKVELEDRLDLSLGQEHAGGGFGGKQAKLGKLIIENEGLQMMDLIVAANMALWWRVYEKFT